MGAMQRARGICGQGRRTSAANCLQAFIYLPSSFILQSVELIIETAAAESHPGFTGPNEDLLAFLTFGASERYGAMHPLSGVANLLRRRHGVNLLPIFHFGDAVPEDEEDDRNLEALWQDAAPLAESCTAAIEKLRAEPRLQQLSAGFPELVPRLDDLRRIAEWAAEHGARVRITYRL